MRITDTATAVTVLAGVLIVVGVVGVVLPGMPGLLVPLHPALQWHFQREENSREKSSEC